MSIPPIILPIAGFAIFSGIWWVIQRRLLTSGLPKSITLFVSGLGASFLIIASVLLYGWPPFSWELAVFLLVNIALSVVIAFCFASAVAKGEASLAVGITAFAPVFAIFVGYVFFKEIPGLMAVFGILIILFGTYVLNVNPRKKSGLMDPLIQIWQERSSWLWYAVGAAVAAGFAIPFERHIIGLSNFLFAPGMELFFGWGIFWGLSALFKKEYRFITKLSKIQIVSFCVAMSFCFVIANAAQGAAYYYSVAASVGALKRLDAPVTVILATIFLGEKGTKYRFWGTLIIAMGAFAIVFGK